MTERRRTLAALTAVLAGAGGLFLSFERRVMYPAPRERVEPVLAGAAVLRIPGAHGRTVHALYLPAPAGEPTIVHFHGNGESLTSVVPLGAWFRKVGVGFCAVEYPGYGLSSDASPEETALYEDAESALRYLAQVAHVPHDHIVLEGQSLGTGVAVEMARRGYGARLVLLSPYTSMADLARRIVPLVPIGALVRDRYDNHEKAPAIRIPTLIIHGSDDEVIPVAMAHALAERFPNVRLRIVNGGHHNDLWLVVPDLGDDIVTFAKSGTE